MMKGGHDQMKNRCVFYSKLGYCEGVVEELGGKFTLSSCICIRMRSSLYKPMHVYSCKSVESC